MPASESHLHISQPDGVVQEELDLLVQLLIVIRLDVQHKVRVGQAHVPLEGQIIRPAAACKLFPLLYDLGACSAHMQAPCNAVRVGHAPLLRRGIEPMLKSDLSLIEIFLQPFIPKAPIAGRGADASPGSAPART